MEPEAIAPASVRARRIILVLVLLLAVVTVVVLATRRHPSEANVVRASGIIEARTIELAPEVPARSSSGH